VLAMLAAVVVTRNTLKYVIAHGRQRASMHQRHESSSINISH